MFYMIFGGKDFVKEERYFSMVGEEELSGFRYVVLRWLGFTGDGFVSPTLEPPFSWKLVYKDPCGLFSLGDTLGMCGVSLCSVSGEGLMLSELFSKIGAGEYVLVRGEDVRRVSISWAFPGASRLKELAGKGATGTITPSEMREFVVLRNSETKCWAAMVVTPD